MLDNGESQKEAIRPNLRRMEERFGIPAIRADLGRLGITNLIGLLGHQRLTRNGLRLINASGPINTVGHQRLEYEAPRSFLEGEDSFFLEQFDPLVQGRRPPQDILLDHYLAYRSRRGEPVAARELKDAADYFDTIGGYGSVVAAQLRRRAPSAAR